MLHKSNVVMVELNLLDPFPQHPFKVVMDDEMVQLMESIRENGIINPIIIRSVGDRYQVISGHRRVYACNQMRIREIPSIIVECSYEDAVVYMVDCNLNRPNILPSEKAFSLKMRYEAIKKQGIRTDLFKKLSLSPVETKSRSDVSLGDEYGISRAQVQRLMRLTFLNSDLLDLVDVGRMKLRPAVEISYLGEDEQRCLVRVINELDATPSHAQAITLRKMSQVESLSEKTIRRILIVPKPNQREKMYIPRQQLVGIIPDSMTNDDFNKLVVKALKFYAANNEQ